MSGALSVSEVKALFPAVDERIAPSDFHMRFLPVIQSFREESNQKPIISHINKLLSTATSRDTGLKYLNLLVFYCNSEILAENVTSWVTLTVGQNKGGGTSKMFKFIANIIPMCNDIQDFNKLMVSSHSLYLNKIVDLCISVQLKSVQIDGALHCLEVCLGTYASTCVTMRARIEQFLLKFLHERVSEITIKRAGRCYHYLQQTGGAGPDGINHIKNWGNALEQLCNTMHSLYDQFFEDLNEFEGYDRSNADTISFPSIPSDFDSTQVFSVVENRLKNVAGFLRAMLETKYPTAKVIIPKCVFDVIKRGLSVHMCVTNATNSTAAIQFNVLLMRHQVDLLHLLRSYVTALQSNIFLFSNVITKLLLKCLARVSGCTCFSNYSTYKEATYKILAYWIALIKNSFSANMHEKLISIILEDIAPIKSDLSLNIASANKSSSSKAKGNKNRHAMNSTELPGLKGHSQNSLNQKESICCKALDCLISIFKNVHISIKQDMLKLVYSRVFKIILKMQCGQVVPPYQGPASELKLYEAVLAMVETPSPIVPFPLYMAVNVFIKGQKHRNFSVVQVCSMGQNVLEKICQPVCPSLDFPVPERECKQKALRGSMLVKVVTMEPEILEVNSKESESDNNKELTITDDNTEQNTVDSTEIDEETFLQLINEEYEEQQKVPESAKEALTQTTSSVNEVHSLETTIITTQEVTTVSSQCNSELDAKEEALADESEPQTKKTKLDESIPKKEDGTEHDDDVGLSSFVNDVVDY